MNAEEKKKRVIAVTQALVGFKDGDKVKLVSDEAYRKIGMEISPLGESGIYSEKKSLTHSPYNRNGVRFDCVIIFSGRAWHARKEDLEHA